MIRAAILFLFLVVAGGAAFLGVRSWLTLPAQENAGPVETKPAVVEEKGVRVIVSKRRLASGTLIKQSDLRWQELPPDEKPAENWLVEGQVTLESLDAAVVRRWVAEGEPVKKGRLVRPGERGFLSAVLRPGYRAVTIAINEIRAVAGLAFPGDRIDLVLSYELTKEGGKGVVHKRWDTMTVLTDIRVLAIDQSTSDQVENPEPAEEPRTVTLEVTPKQAEIVALAAKLGTLSLALRSFPPGEGQVTQAKFAKAGGESPAGDSDGSRLPRVFEFAPASRRMEVVRGVDSVMIEFERDDE